MTQPSLANADLPTGYTCECGTTHSYPSYVFAHWRDVLVHSCDNCRRKHEIVCGIATPYEESLPPRKAVRKKRPTNPDAGAS